MKIPSTKPTKRQLKQLAEVRHTLGNFAQMFELATRAKAAGIDAEALCALVGCTRFNAPTADTITEEQLQIIRTAVEKAEKGVK